MVLPECILLMKKFVFLQDNEKLVFENLYKLQKWDNGITSYLPVHVKVLKNVYETLRYLMHFVHSIF